MLTEGLFTIAENTPLTPRVSRLRLLGDASAVAGPGQFVQIRIPGFSLRRPFSVGSKDPDGLTVCYQAVGTGTETLRGLPPGEQLDLLTGLGNCFDLSRAGQRPLLIGGGTGASPLLYLAKELISREIQAQVLLGFGSLSEIILLEEFRALGLSPIVTTADGSFGIPGLVTDVMDPHPGFFYACGPLPMLRAVCEKSGASGQLSLEARMGCGFGACMGCTIRTSRGPKRVCREGPVFDKEDLLWED